MNDQNESLRFLKQILSNQDVDLITDAGYEMLASEHVVNSHDQAKVIARLVKDLAQNNYNSGYTDGRVDQATKDAYERGLSNGRGGGK